MSMLTIVWDLPDDISAERAIALAERWAARELGGDTRLPRPVRVSVVDDRSAADHGADIARRRKALRLTQSDLAQHARISKNTISRAERGYLHPTSHIMTTLRRALTALEGR